MFTGQGEKANRQAHQKFWDAIPDESGFKEEDHPAVSGPLAKSFSAFDYRRFNSMNGPKSKREHRYADLREAKDE